MAFNADQAYDDLKDKFIWHKRFSNMIKSLTYMGMEPQSTTNYTVAAFYDLINNVFNHKALLDSYGKFVENVYTHENLQERYPCTYRIAISTKAYLDESVTIQEIAETMFEVVFATFDNEQGKMYTTEEKKEAFQEYSNALASEEAYLLLQTPGELALEKISDLYGLLYDSPNFDTITPNTNAYIVLAFMLYAIQHYKAYLAVSYISSDWLNTHKEQFAEYNHLRVYPIFGYPSSGGTCTLYYNKNTYEFTDVEPDEDVGYEYETFPNIPAFDPNLPIITSHKLQIGTGSEVNYLRVNFYDLDGNGVTAATFEGNILGQSCAFNKPIVIDYETIQSTTFHDDYYRYMDTDNQYWHATTYFLKYNSGYYIKVDELSLPAEVMKTVLNNGDMLQVVYYIDGESMVIPQTRPMIPNPAYEGVGPIRITDEQNSPDPIISVPLDEDMPSIWNHEMNLTDVMADNGNYVTAVADPNTVIRVPDSQVPAEMPITYRDLRNPLVDVLIPPDLISLYILSPGAAGSLAREFYRPDVVDILKKTFSEPIESIISFGMLPFELNRLEGLQNIVIGNYTTGVMGNKRKNQYYEFTYGAHQYEPLGFEDREPYATYEIHIPYCGMYPILSSEFAGKLIQIDCICDILTGDILTTLNYRDSYGKLPLRKFTGNAMRKIPLSASSGDAMFNTILKGAAIAGSAMSGAVVNQGGTMGAWGGALSSLAPDRIAPTVSTVGDITQNTGYMDTPYPYIIGRKQTFRGGTISKNIGRRVNISDVSGITTMCNIQTQYLGRSITEAIKPAITGKEITEIEELAVAGIVI